MRAFDGILWIVRAGYDATGVYKDYALIRYQMVVVAFVRIHFEAQFPNDLVPLIALFLNDF